MSVNTGLGGSRLYKDEQKNFIWDPGALVSGPGISLDVQDLTTYSGSKARHKTVLSIEGMPEGGGFTGDVAVASGILTVVNGIITDYTVS